DRGILVEQGTHDDLMAAGGLYARLYEEEHRPTAAGAPGAWHAERLRRVPLFADLSVEVLAAIDRQLQLERSAASDTIIHQGEFGDKMYLLDRGHVEVVLRRGSEEYRLNTLREGDYFGEIALLHETQRTATVRALRPVRVLTLSSADLRRLIAQAPELV